ncbi:hypothetical protein C5167_017738 [Papaver somniferum]|uniref:Uncharacterized protein n=1 Tax=Papaver somniferum TaxID=3469 RepID=A0A4Y7INC6_PAPSO|nr:hypothetical protein C5167_017738 [Papaver somniferum]
MESGWESQGQPRLFVHSKRLEFDVIYDDGSIVFISHKDKKLGSSENVDLEVGASSIKAVQEIDLNDLPP